MLEPVSTRSRKPTGNHFSFSDITYAGGIRLRWEYLYPWYAKHCKSGIFSSWELIVKHLPADHCFNRFTHFSKWYDCPPRCQKSRRHLWFLFPSWHNLINCPAMSILKLSPLLKTCTVTTLSYQHVSPGPLQWICNGPSGFYCSPFPSFYMSHHITSLLKTLHYS